MATAAVTDKQELEMCTRMRSRVRVGKLKFNVVERVGISKKNEIRKGVGTELY
jgi:hypothetical protein